MENHQPLSSEKFIERIASDKALHDVLQPLLEEVRELRKELGQLRDVIGDGRTIRYLTIPEVAQMFNVCEETVRRRTRSGEWPALALVVGRQTRIGPEELAAIKKIARKPPSLQSRPGRSSLERRELRNRLNSVF
jgi:excisionase family DNA binding protein